MKCFILSSYRDLMAPRTSVDEDSSYPRHYPTAVPGLRLDRTDRTLVLGGQRRIPVSKELLQSSDPNAVQRDGSEVVILRASLKGTGDKLELVPETAEDADKALLKSDIFGAPTIRYEGTDEQIAARVGYDDLGMHHELVLAVLTPFEPLNAVRSGKRWRRSGLTFYREACVKERLPIKFDGQKIFYEILRG